MVFVMKLRLMSWAQSEITADIHALDDGLTKETEEESSFFWVSSSRKGNKKGTDEKKTGKKKKKLVIVINALYGTSSIASPLRVSGAVLIATRSKRTRASRFSERRCGAHGRTP